MSSLACSCSSICDVLIPYSVLGKRSSRPRQLERIWKVLKNVKIVHVTQKSVGVEFAIKPCSHLTSAFAFLSNIMNGFYGNKWWVSYLTFCFWRQRSKKKADAKCEQGLRWRYDIILPSSELAWENRLNNRFVSPPPRNHCLVSTWEIIDPPLITMTATNQIIHSRFSEWSFYLPLFEFIQFNGTF